MSRAGAIALATLVVPGLASAEMIATPHFSLPAIVERADSPEGFLPKGWRIERLVRGDLDGDGRGDAALVVKGGDPTMIVKNPGGPGAREVDANPRALLVVFSERGGFRLVSKSFGVIPDLNDPELRDPFVREAFRIVGGLLHVEFVKAKRSGGGETRRVAYRFRHLEGRMHAARYERTLTDAATGETETLVVDVAKRVGTRMSGRAGVTSSRRSWPLDRVENGVRMSVGGVDVSTPGNGLEFDHAY